MVKKFSSLIVLFVLAILSVSPACGDEDPIRSYIEDPQPAERATSPHSSRPGAQSAELQWDTPDGWRETRKESGFRLASFSISSPQGDMLCTVTPLKGEGGGIEANVQRWRDQLGLTDMSGDRFTQFLSRQETFSSAGGFEGLFVDFTPHVPDDQQPSLLTAIIKLEGNTIFFKLSGPNGAVKNQKRRFKILCRSFRKQ